MKMLNTFYDSYRILMRVYGQGTFLKQAINSETIEPINKNAVIKICYGVLENDIYFDYIISLFSEKRPKLPVRVILKIAIYNINFLNKAGYAVTDNAVELLKKLGKGGAAGFLNAFLRKFIHVKDEISLPDAATDKRRYFSVKYSYPLFAVDELIKDYGEEKAEKIMAYKIPHNYVRFNDGISGAQYLDSLGKNYDSTPYFNLFDVKNFNRNEDYDKGIYTFQSIGSVAICDAIDNGERILDSCAAPGGKTVLLADKFNFVTATELHEHRAELIKTYAARMHKSNIEVFTADSSMFNENFKEKFDAVLCDSPCSGYGVVYENPDIKLNRVKQNLDELLKTQIAILKNCSKYVKKGGYLYYSTCSIFSCENDGIIEKFNPESFGFKVIFPEIKLNGLKTRFGTQFLPDISLGAGFYLCKMQKL